MVTAVERKQMYDEMLADMTDIENIETRAKVLIDGPKGVGKTVFVVSFAKAVMAQFSPTDKQELVYVDTSEGYVSLRNHPKLNTKIRVVRYRNLQYLGTLLMAIKAGAPPFDHVGALVLDEFSKMAERDLEEYTLKRDPEALIPEWPDYNQSQFRAKMLMKQIYEIPNLHLFMVSHEKDKKNKQGDTILTMPNFNPQFGEVIMQDLHVIGRMTAKAVKNRAGQAEYTREIQVHPTGLIEAKTRVGGLPVKVSPGELITRTLDWLSNPEADVAEEVKVSDEEVEIDLSVNEDEVVKIES